MDYNLKARIVTGDLRKNFAILLRDKIFIVSFLSQYVVAMVFMPTFMCLCVGVICGYLFCN